MKTPTSNSYNSEYIKEIEYLRGFAILAVIVIHTSAVGTTIRPLNFLAIANIFIDTFSHFAVPLFIFISGFVLAIKYYGNFSLGLFYKKRAKSIIPQYLLFSIFYTVLVAILYSPPTLLRIIKNILTATSYYHMWFFAVLIQFYVFYPIIIRLYHYFNDKNKIYTLLLLSLLIQISWNIIIGKLLFNSISDILNIQPIKMSTDRIFFSYLFYFMAGIYVSSNYNSAKLRFYEIKLYKIMFISLILTAAISLFWIAKSLSYDYIYGINLSYFIRFFEPVLYVSVFIICFKISEHLILRKKSRTGSVLQGLGNYSFGIYLIHVFFMTLLDMGFGTLGIRYTDWIFYPILFFTTIILSYFSVHFLSYLPHSEMIVGVHSEN